MLRRSWQAGLQLEVATRIAAVRREDLGCRSYKRASWEAARSRSSPDKWLLREEVAERRGALAKRSQWKVAQLRKLARPSIHPSIYPSLHSLLHWFMRTLIHWISDSLIHWFIDSSTHSFTPSLIHWFIGSLVHKKSSLIHRLTNSHIHRLIDSFGQFCMDSVMGRVIFSDPLIHGVLSNIMYVLSTIRWQSP